MKREKKPIKKLKFANLEGERPRHRTNRYGRINAGLLLKMLDEGKSQRECAKFFEVSPAAICIKLKRIAPLPIPESLKKLKPQERKFVLEKVSGKTATQSALSSYEVSSLDSAKSIGVQLMKKPGVQVAIQDLLDLHLPQENRIKRLNDWVENPDPTASLRALDLSWKLDGSYAPDKKLTVQMTYADYIRQKCALRDEMFALKKELETLTNKPSEGHEAPEGREAPGQVIEGQVLEGQCIPGHETSEGQQAKPEGGSQNDQDPNDQDPKG